MFAMATERKNFKKSLYRKPKELELKYLTWNIVYSVSTKFVQINALRSKLAQPREIIDFPYLYIIKT
jgi:hypothetical protein